MRDNIKQLGDTSDVRSLARGEWPVSAGPKKRDELAEVMSYNRSANAYTVVTRGAGGDANQAGGKHLVDIPRKTDNPGILAPLPLGTIVVINWELGFPYIDGVLPINSNPVQVEMGPNKPAPLAGDNSVAVPPDTTTQRRAGYYRQRGAPDDALQGDQVLFTEDGNRIAALRGNYNVMDAGPGTKAKRETIGKKDLIRDTCGDYELETDFGTLRVYNSQGRCGLEFMAAADQLNESGGSEEQWTFSLAIGEPGDYFDMKIKSTDGATKAEAHISPDGQVNFLATNGMSWINGGKAPAYEESFGPIIKRFLSKLTQIVGGESDYTYQASRTTSISANDIKSVGNLDSIAVNGNQVQNIGGNRQATVMGGLVASPLNIAVETQILNGGYILEIGNPLAGAIPTVPHDYVAAINNGNMVFGQNPGLLSLPATRATVSLNTLLPGSIALGGVVPGMTPSPNAIPALMHGVMYEPLLTLLTTMIGMFDTHVHNPPVVGTPSVPMSPLLSSLGLLFGFMSQRVLIGG